MNCDSLDRVYTHEKTSGNFNYVNQLYIRRRIRAKKLYPLTGVLEQDLVHVRGRVLEELVVRVEDDDGDLAVAKHAQLVRLLHEAELALGERHLTVALVRDARDLDLLPTHLAESCKSEGSV